MSEYTALQMKKAVVGHGHAAKAQIRHMVMRLLNLPREPNNDASDALGLAICHAHAGHAMSQMARATELTRRTHAQIKGGRVYLTVFDHAPLSRLNRPGIHGGTCAQRC